MAKDIVTQREAIKESEKKGRGGGRGGRSNGYSPEEKFDNRVELIRQEGRASFFSDLDRQLISQLREIKSDPGLAEKAVDDIKAGRALTGRAKELRNANELKKSGELARDARDQYGTLSDVLPLVAERQRILNIAVEKGNITQSVASQSVQAYANSFGAFQKINSIADSVTSSLETMFNSAIENPKKAQEVWH
jgi:hypothetical protein